MDVTKFFAKKELTAEEKRRRLEKTAFAKKNKSHAFAKKVFICFITTYALFFSSNIWLPVTSADDFPSFYTPENLGRNQQITLIRYDYCEEQGVAEIELDIEQTTYEKGDLYLTAYLDEETVLPISYPVDEPDNKVIRITGITEPSHKITFECLFERSEEDADTLYFVYKPQNVTQVTSLAEKTENEYKIQRCHINIDRYNQDLDGLKENIDEQKAVITDIDETNAELEEMRTIQTAEEQESSAKRIEDNLTARETANENIKDYEQQIIEINQKITEENQKITKLQHK